MLFNSSICRIQIKNIGVECMMGLIHRVSPCLSSNFKLSNDLDHLDHLILPCVSVYLSCYNFNDVLDVSLSMVSSQSRVMTKVGFSYCVPEVQDYLLVIFYWCIDKDRKWLKSKSHQNRDIQEVERTITQ